MLFRSNCFPSNDSQIILPDQSSTSINIYCDDQPLVTIELPDNSPAEVTIKLPPEEFSSLLSQQRASDVLDISIVQSSGSNKKFEVCFPVDEKFDSKSCLGFIDETKEPPEWKCEDRSVKKNKDGLVCGKTDHFTNFAILLTGVNEECGDNKDYVTGSYAGDLILVACFVGVVICICLLVIVFSAFSTSISKVVYGTEGHRIRTLRNTGNRDTMSPNDESYELIDTRRVEEEEL